MQKQPITATRYNKYLRAQVGADFLVAPLNSSMSWRSFKGTEQELRAWAMSKYGREIYLVEEQAVGSVRAEPL